MMHGQGHKNTFETNFPIEKSVRKAEKKKKKKKKENMKSQDIIDVSFM